MVFDSDLKWKWMDTEVPDWAFKKSPTLHYCIEWDNLLIEDTDPEYSACRCFGQPKKVVPSEAKGGSNDIFG